MEPYEAGWWRVRSGAEKIRFFSYTRSQYSSSEYLQKKGGIMLVLKWVMFCLIPCTTVQYQTHSFGLLLVNCVFVKRAS